MRLEQNRLEQLSMIESEKSRATTPQRVAIVLLLALAGLRIVAIFAADPLLAIANNYDMIRVQACIDAYPVRNASIPPWANSFEAPLERYRFTPDVGAPCFFTSEALFAWVAWPGMELQQRFFSNGDFSIRWVGAVKLLLFGLAVLLINRALLQRGAIDLALGHAALVAVVLADPAVSLYLNTFYAEYAAVFFGYVLLGLLSIAIATSGSTLSRRLLLGIGLAAILLATSKVQHVLAPLFILAMLLVLRSMGAQIRVGILAALAVGALLGAALQGANLASAQNRTMAHANLINTVFFAVLPNADDPLRITRELGLPDACAAQSGKNWTSPGMQEKALCPQAFELTRVDLARVLLMHPRLIARVVLGGVSRSRPWIPSGLGVVEHHVMGHLPGAYPSLDRALMMLPDRLYLALTVCLPLMAAFLIARRRRREQTAANCILAILVTLPWLSLLVVVFGDGYFDTAKQSHFGTAALLAGVCLFALLVLRAGWATGKATTRGADFCAVD
jgi:hypothetical protein